jgi:hypothetical protein
MSLDPARAVGFPNRVFNDSWVAGFWRAWQARRRIGKASLGAGSTRFWIAWATRRGDRCVRFYVAGDERRGSGQITPTMESPMSQKSLPSV